MTTASPILDARALGASGNNIADDTAVLQAALDQIGQGPATTLYLPPGEYRITRPLILRGSLATAAVIRGESGTVGGSMINYDGPAGSPCVLEVAGGFGVTLERFLIHGRCKAQFGIYLHDDLPRAGMFAVTVREVTIYSPMAGDSPDLPVGGKSAAISIGLRPDGAQNTDQCDSIKLIGVMLLSSGDRHAANYAIATGTGNVKNFFIEHPWIQGFQVGLAIPNGTGTCTVTGGAAMSMTVSDFLIGSGMLAVTGWESEGSSRLLTTPGWSSSYASASFDRCAWYGSPADDIAVMFCGALALRGCDFRTTHTTSSVPKIALIPSQAGSVTSLISEQNFYQNATAAPFTTNTNAAIAAKDGTYPPWVRSFGDLGGVAGKLVPLGGLPSSTTLVTPVAPDTLRAKDLILTGSIDFGDGRKWTKEGLFLNGDQYWTEYGITPGVGVRWPGSGTITSGPNESLRYVGWEERPIGSGNRRQGWIVPPLRNK